MAMNERERANSARREQVLGRIPPDLKDPEIILSLLEADQVVAAKQETRFGRKQLSLKMRFMLWGLRIYLVIMLVIVAISVIRALHGGH